MRMKKIISITFGFVSATSVASAFCFAGCTSLFSFNGNFSQDEIVLSVGQEFLPSDFFEGSKKVDFFVQDEKIVKKNEEGIFTAVASGKTTITAKSGNLDIDSTKIYVKYNFQTPSNLQITNDGLIYWDSCAVALDGEMINPTYKVSINGTEYDSLTNEYQLSQGGTFKVKVKANGTARVDESSYSEEISFDYDLIEGAKEVKFESYDVFGSQKGKLTWQGSGNGVLTIDNIQQDVLGNEKILDFSSYAEESEIKAKLFLTNNEGESKTAIKTIKKLNTKEVEIRNGEICWQTSNSVKKTLIKAVSSTGEEKIVQASSNNSVLEGLDEGIYTISYQAIGLEGYANGSVKDFAYEIGKVKNVEVEEYSAYEGKIKIKFATSSEYNKKFIVKQNKKTFEFEFTDEKNSNGKYELEKEFSLDLGLNDFSIQAIPTIEDGKSFEFDGNTARLAIKSDEKKIVSAYKIDEIGEISHSIDEDENSILIFNNVDFAKQFSATINGVTVENLTWNIGENQTTVNLGKITKSKYGNSQQFNIVLTATRPFSENEIVSTSISTKTLTMLSQPNMSNCAHGQNQAETYSWEEVENAKYYYELYLTDESFNTINVNPFTETTTDNKTKLLTAGYYVIRVRSLPINEDEYLPSEELSQDLFYYSEQIASPQIRLDYISGLSSEYSGYIIKIKTVEFGYQYKVLFGDSETNLGSIYNFSGLDELTFNLPSTAVLDGSTQIKVVSIAKDAAAQKIHSNTTSILNIEKLSAPTQYSIIENNSKIEVQNIDEKAVVNVFKNGTMIAQSEIGKNVVADISAYDGEFTIQAQTIGYDEFEGYTTNGTTKISSNLASFTLHRSQTPYNLVYNSGNVSFEHSDRAEKYVVLIEVESTNGTIKKTFEPTLISSETNSAKKSFNLENEIAALRLQDSEFNAIFTQKSKITLSLFAYISQEVESKYYISSFNATAKHNSEQREIVVSKLDSVNVEYDYDRKVMYWDGDENLEPIYDIYLDGALKATIKTKSTNGKYEYDISSYDFSKAGEYKFYVIASSNNALSSDKSKNIVVRKISQVQKLDVISKTDGYYAKFAFAAGDEGHIDDVIINDESNGAKSEFKLNADTFEIVIKGENYVDASGDKIYYISSEKSTFSIAQLKLNAFEAQSTISSETISWKDYATANANSWSLTTPDKNLKYMIEIYIGETLKTSITNISTNSLSLTNEKLLNLASGNYSFKLYAYVGEYEIANGGSGYYGKILLEENISIKKLTAISNLAVTIDNSEGSIAEELSKDIVLSWEYDDVGSSDVFFEIFINDRLEVTTAAKTYTFSQSYFRETENTISIMATSSTDVNSDKVEIKLFRYSQPKISIDDRGILRIIDNDVPAVASGYIIEVTMTAANGEPHTDEYYTMSREYDLNAVNAGINERSGEMRVRVLQRTCTSGVNAIPTIAAETSKIVLAAPTISQNSSGFVISSTDTGVTYYVKCSEKNYNKQIEENVFVYPDEWESGTYNLVIYAQRPDAIDSWKNTSKTITIDRVNTATQIAFERDLNYLDYNLSWEAVEDVNEYEIEVFKNNSKIGKNIKVGTNNIKLSIIRAAIDEFKSGDYTLSLRSLVDFSSTAKTNSTPLRIKVSVAENTVNSVNINDFGKLTFNSNNQNNFYIVTKQTDSEDEWGEMVESSATEYSVPRFTGKLEVSIAQIVRSETLQTATDGATVYVNGAAVISHVTKLQDLVSVSANSNNGKITINVVAEADEDKRGFIVSYGGVEKTLGVVKDTKATAYEFYAIDMIQLFNNPQEGDFEFKLFSIMDGFVRSDEYSCTIKYYNHNNSSKTVKQDEENDYIILTGDFVDDAAILEGQSESNAITVIHILTNEEFYSFEPTFGFWIENNNSGAKNKNYFSAVAETGSGIVCTPCCAINISDLLKNVDAGKIHIRIGFVLKVGEEFAVVNYSDIYEYKKLAAVEQLRIDEGNFTWAKTDEENTAFILYFDGKTEHQKVRISASQANYYYGENVNMSEEFTAGVKAVSSMLQIIPSKIVNYQSGGRDVKISQLAKVESELYLTDGVLKLEFNTNESPIPPVEGLETESAGVKSEGLNAQKDFPSIEKMLANRLKFNLTTDFAKQLVSNRLTQPFSFRLEELEDLEFNLKFVQSNNETGEVRSYYTTVKAINILSELKQETLIEIKKAFTDEQISDDNKKELNKVYKMLTNIEYFTGVASSNLLFREIGENEYGGHNFYPASKIPYGTYDIYIQQIGSAKDSTISSQYKLAKQGVNVVKSPITRVDSKQINDGETNVYYVKFVPIEGKTTYTMALRDKETDEVIEYTISNLGNNTYVRSTFTEENTISLEYKDGFVWIPMNGDNGIIYDEGVKNSRGYDVVVKEIKEKNEGTNIYDNVRNGQKYGGKDGIIAIGEKIYSYTWDNGAVKIDALDVKNNEFTLDGIVYSIIPVGISGKDFVVDIYANGDSVDINGKSDPVSVAFLKFNIESLKLENGEFKWRNFVSNATVYPATVVTKQKNTTEKNTTIVNGVDASFTPAEEGGFDTLKFFTKGIARDYEIKVDSDVYVFKNLYKLKSPKIQVVDGRLVIKDNTETADQRTEKDFILSNNNSELSHSENIKLKDGVFELNWETGIGSYERNGEEDELYDYHLTERGATAFYAAVSGDNLLNSDLKITANNIGTKEGYYLITVTGESDRAILLQSNKAGIEAAKLAYDDADPKIKIENGDLSWSSSSKSMAEDTLESSSTGKKEGELNILYQVTIDYYYQSSNETWDKYSSKTIYTTEEKLNSEYIVDPVAGVEFRYVISVRANVYAYTTGNSEIVTIEKLKYNRISEKTYNHSSRYILNGETVIRGKSDKGENLIARTNQVSGFDISKQSETAGKLMWSATESAVGYKIFAINNGESNALKGENVKSGDKVYFDMPSEKLSVEKVYNFKILAYDERDKIASSPVRLHTTEDVKILPNITASDYEIKVKETGNEIYFDSYFSNYSKEYGNLIKVYIIKDKDKNGQTIGNKEGYQVGDGDTLTVWAVPGESVNPNKYLRSDSGHVLSLASCNFTSADGYYFDDESKTLYWTFGTEYLYSVNKQDGAEIYLNKEDGSKYEFGVYNGEELGDKFLDENFNSGKIGIVFHDKNGELISDVYVNKTAVKIENGLVVKNNLGADFEIYNGSGQLIKDNGGNNIIIESGKEYPLSAKSFVIEDTNPFTGEKGRYYLPSEKIKYDGNNILAMEDSPYYLDEDCALRYLVGNETLLKINTWNTGEYQEITSEKNTTCFIKTSDILKYLAQNEDSKDYISGVTFQIGFVASYSYESGGATFQNTETRIYKNVPIGEITSHEINGIAVSKDGVRVTAFELPVVGKITNIEIRARKTKNNLVSNTLLSVPLSANSSESLGKTELSKQEYLMDLFSLGDGTETNPYLISKNEEFENINYRLEKPDYLSEYYKRLKYKKVFNNQTTTGTAYDGDVKEEGAKYFFKQTEALSFDIKDDGFKIKDNFNGIYDGNKKEVGIKIESLALLNESEFVTTSLPVSSGYADDQIFKKGAGLFKQVGKNGIVKNINLNFSMNINSALKKSIATEKTLVGGLVFKNLGKVDSVTVVSSSVTFESALEQSAALAVAPVVGENRGNTANLVSTADVTIENKVQSSGSQHFYYGGIVGFHNAGTLLLSKSQNVTNQTSGEISVSFTSNTNGTVAVGGIAITARALIDMAINTKNISAAANGGSAFAGGVVCLGVGATLYSCVNTADVSSTYAGGIAYAFYNTNVSALVGLGTVNKSVQNLFAKTMSFASSSTSETVYTYSTYKPSGSFKLTTLSGSRNITCKNKSNYRIAVSVSSNVYTADIIFIK